MSPLDRESLFFKIEKIRASLRVLRKLAKIPFGKYVKDIEHTMTAERLLQVSIEAMLDVGNHIIASEGLPAPLEYRDVFRVLGREEILSSKLAERCQTMVGLRNRLVHDYTDIDHEKIHAFLKNDLGDFEDYVKAIANFAKKNS